MTGRRVLAVDDDPLVLSSLSESLSAQGLIVETARSGEEAVEKVRTLALDLILADIRLPRMTGLTLLKHCRGMKPGVPVIMMTGYGSIGDAVRSMKHGASDYLTKPIDEDALRVAMLRALKSRRLHTENNRLRRRFDLRPARLNGIISQDYRMRKVCETVLQVADSDATVLITGESGTGKTLIARLIHESSPRHAKPFVEVNCAALPDTLLESELFGHVKGAFTSATTDRTGKFQTAEGGTIFLDEVGNASPSLQMKLLRAVQHHELERVGDTTTIKVDCRFLAATNTALEEEVKAGQFRQDLYHRLNVIGVALPPLRERIGDIPLLCRHLLRELAAQHKKSVVALDDAVMQRLARYHWPGNVRELRNVIEHGIILSQNDTICLEHLPSWLVDASPTPLPSDQVRPLREALQHPERACIIDALKATSGNKQLAAKKLAISRSTLYNKIKELGLNGLV